MRKSNPLLAALILVGLGTAVNATQELSQDKLDTSEKISTVNENFRGLSYGKLDALPRGINPFSDSKYSLGESGREWLALYVDQLIISGAWDGWVGSTQTWTYISATQFSMPGTQTGVFQKGDKLKLSQTTTKYFYITTATAGVGVTTFTVSGGTDYTLANAAITSPYSSKVSTPQGFPNWFSYTPSWTSDGVAPVLSNGTMTGKFTINGRTVTTYFTFVAGNTTTFGTGEYRISTPTAASNPAFEVWNGGWMGTDAGVAFYVGFLKITSGANGYIQMMYQNAISGTAASVTNAAPFSWGNTDTFAGTFTYEL